jgi:hypothetical protein
MLSFEKRSRLVANPLKRRLPDRKVMPTMPMPIAMATVKELPVKPNATTIRRARLAVNLPEVLRMAILAEAIVVNAILTYRSKTIAVTVGSFSNALIPIQSIN